MDMKNRESHRRVPMSIIALAAVSLLIAFEAMVIGGAFEIRASTVAKVAPWAYEPFLRLVGEHPDSYRHRQPGEAVKGTREGESAVQTTVDLDMEMLMLKTNEGMHSIEPPASNAVESAIIKSEEPAQEAPELSEDEEIPVG